VVSLLGHDACGLCLLSRVLSMCALRGLYGLVTVWTQEVTGCTQQVLAAGKAGVAIQIAGVSSHFCCPSDGVATQGHWREVQQVHSSIVHLLQHSSIEVQQVHSSIEPMLAQQHLRHPRPMLHAASGAPAALMPHTQVFLLCFPTPTSLFSAKSEVSGGV